MGRALKILLAVVVVGAIGAGIFLALRHAPAPTQPAAPDVASPAAPATAAPQADCLLPGPAPVPPDGRTATAADMSLGHDAAQGFVLQLEAYQACRNAQIDHAAPGVSDKQKDSWTQQGNAAVDQANAIAAAYAEQLKIFKARTPAK